MLTAGGRARHARKSHRHTRKHERLHHRTDRVRVALCGGGSRRGAFFNGIRHKLRNQLAAVFALQVRAKLPVGEGDVFSQHVAEARGDHLRGRLRKDLGIGDDGIGIVGVEACFRPAADDRRGGTGVAVHARRGADDEIRQMQSSGDKARDVVQRAGADGDQKRVVFLLVRGLNKESAEGERVRMQVLFGENIAVRLCACGEKVACHLFAEHVVGMAVADDQHRAFFKIRRCERRDMVGCAAGDVDRADMDRMMMAAIAVEIDLCQLRNRACQDIFLHRKPLLWNENLRKQSIL